nr:hypothetical protein [Tanacetum cinerariifolium]
EPASPLGDGSQGEACPINSSLATDQDRPNIAKTSTLPSDSTPRVTSLAADEGNQSGDDAPIKGRRLDVGEEAAERVSDDTEEMATILTSMDAATILSSEVAKVPTGSGSIPTADPPATGVPTGSDVVPTASLIFATATVMDIQMDRQLEEEMEKDAQRMNEQIARDAEIARIHAEEELQMMINRLDRSNETTLQRKPRSKKQKKDYYMAVIKGHAGWKTKDFKGMSFEQIETRFNTIWKQIEDFIPMGSKEETERFKRKGLRLEQVSEKKLKTSEEVPEEVKATEEVPEDKVKETMQLVPVEEVYVEALQVKHPIIDWKGRIVGNKMHKAFPLPVMEFPLSEEVPTTEESSHCQKKRDVPAKKITLLLKSSSNCQSKSYDSYAKLVPHV